ncbi:hybrid sensor histidine kinase/response regulator transcription factor [Mongoliibacter ruber]|uniref:histidine kinase n=1 Tax=Mongoliibacter ruber TaxID=1750599 RepID=A0A2T0WPC1_9BACT|nr:hybrid sensor histidine kinase/response regulator transcription factor [Mongoliibacter ruber]PRY88549.1 two component regulator with propeller domain [Mongoliibacter ruber]
MPHKSHLLYLLLIFISIEAGFGQQLPYFTTLTSRDGLPSNTISAIAQDSEDFIWVGTANGVARYDGNSFLIFRKEEYPLLAANEISSLLAVGEEIWVGTWKGLSRINSKTFEITPVELDPTIAIRTMYLDPKGIVWVGSTKGLLRFNGEEMETFDVKKNGLSHNMVRSVFMDHEDNLWVGTYDRINKLPSGKGKFTSYELKGNYKPSLKNNLIMDIKPDQVDRDYLWVGTETGLVRMHIPSGSYETFNEENAGFSNEVIKSIYLTQSGDIYMGTDFGVNIFKPEDESVEKLFHHPELPYSIGSNVSMQIFEDSGGVVWFVTSNGLSLFNKYGGFYSYHEVNHILNQQKIGSQVKSILISKKGDIWLATLNGVIKIDAETGKQEVFDIHARVGKNILLNNVYALEEDEFGRIWIGTAGGINVWDEQNQKMYAISSGEQNGLESNYIAKFIKANDGTFWVSAWEGGLYKVGGNFKEISSLIFEKASEYGTEKTVTGANAVWVVNYDELFRIDLQSHRNTSVNSFNKVSNRRSLNALYFSKKGNLWAATTNGLIEYQPQTDQAIFHPLHIGKDFVLSSITEDSKGQIWGATSGFIIKFQPSDNTFEIFPLDKGLPIKSFFEACWGKDKMGNLYFGGDNGYISISPDAQPNNFKPRLFFSKIRINNTLIQPGNKSNDDFELPSDIAFVSDLKLHYSQRSIAIDFSSLHFWQPEKNIYAYKLEGHDKDWSYSSGSGNTAIYSNLSPGKYTLRLKGSNNYGIWSDEIKTLDFEIYPPLFLSNLFIFFYFVLALGAIVFALRFYSSRIHLRNEVKLARMEKAHSEEIAVTKQQFFTNISHELRTPISLILPPIQQALDRVSMDEKTKSLLQLAEKNSNRLLRLVNQILDFRKLEQDSLELKVTSFDLVGFCKDLCELFVDKASRNEIQFRFHSDLETCYIWADRDKLETVLYNLLSNAFKFTSESGTVEMLLKTHPADEKYIKGGVEIQIHDTGIGIESDEQDKIFDRFYQTGKAKQIDTGSGIGLSMVKEYTKLHYGEVKVDSQVGEGACFTVILPMGNIHYPFEVEQKSNALNLLASKQEGGNSAEEYQYDLDSGKPIVLIVEDYPDMVDYLSIHLKEDYHLVIAHNGQEALEKIKSFLPEVIISDIMMPVMDGLTLCKKIKENPKTSHIGMILLTAKSLTSQKIEGIKTGADAYLTKPFDLELLKANIEQLIKRKDELHNYFKSEIITQPILESQGESVDDKFIKKVISIIEANISNPDFTVELLSDEIGMSTAHLYRKLKSLTHFSAKEIIRKYRLKKASILLKNKEGNISEIMYEVGFSNLSYFAKCFRKEYDMSPRDFQQSNSTSSPSDFRNELYSGR